MFVQASDTSKTLDKKCCKIDDGKTAIIMDASCMVAYKDGSCQDDKVCLGGLNIPVCSTTKKKKKLKAGATYVVDDADGVKFLAVYITENKNCFWRELDVLADNYETLNYKVGIVLTTGDLTADKVTVTAVITMTPDYKSVAYTWDDITNLQVNGVAVTKWKDIKISWLQAAAGNQSNTLKLPVVTGTITGTLYIDDDELNLAGVLTGTVTNGTISYTYSMSANYDIINEEITTSVDSVVLSGEFIENNLYLVVPSATNVIADDIATVTYEDILVRTYIAKRYRVINALLVLSSTDTRKLSPVEFYNSSNHDVELNILYAN